MNISKKSQYGLRAMVQLAKNYNPQAGGRVFLSTKRISEKEGIPFDFLEKIFLNLEKVKLVKGKKGTGGGYILAKSPGKITVKDIVNPLENTTAVDCSFCDKSKKCLAKNVWRKIDKAMEKTLKSITLAELIR